jgi:hypothetical protein
MSAIAPLPWHAAVDGDGHHWVYQGLVVLVIAGVWLFFAGLGERLQARRETTGSKAGARDTGSTPSPRRERLVAVSCAGHKDGTSARRGPNQRENTSENAEDEGRRP